MRCSSRTPLRTLLLGVALAGLAACEAPAPTAPSAAAFDFLASGDAYDDDGGAEKSGLLYCPTDEDRDVEGVVGPEGGTLSVAGHRLVVPAGAVSQAVRLRIRVRESDYLEVSFRANDLPGERFAQPVTIELSYARCADLYAGAVGIAAWHVDELTGARLEHMGGVVDPERRTVTFATDHFSVYALAN